MNQDPVGRISLWQSKPEYTSIFWGNIEIPVEIAEEALRYAARNGRGQVVCKFKVNIYENDQKGNDRAPILSGQVQLDLKVDHGRSEYRGSNSTTAESRRPDFDDRYPSTAYQQQAPRRPQPRF
jgi:hypothetical protein